MSTKNSVPSIDSMFQMADKSYKRNGENVREAVTDGSTVLWAEVGHDNPIYEEFMAELGLKLTCPQFMFRAYVSLHSSC